MIYVSINPVKKKKGFKRWRELNLSCKLNCTVNGVVCCIFCLKYNVSSLRLEN